MDWDGGDIGEGSSLQDTFEQCRDEAECSAFTTSLM